MANDILPAPRQKQPQLWKKGQSGNPAGRPKGVKNKITLMKQMLEGELRAQVGPHMAEVLAKALEMAKDGNEAMIKLLIDKTLPSTKASDDGEAADNRVQIVIGKLPERKEDITITGEKIDG